MRARVAEASSRAGMNRAWTRVAVGIDCYAACLTTVVGVCPPRARIRFVAIRIVSFETRVVIRPINVIRRVVIKALESEVWRRRWRRRRRLRRRWRWRRRWRGRRMRRHRNRSWAPRVATAFVDLITRRMIGVIGTLACAVVSDSRCRVDEAVGIVGSRLALAAWIVWRFFVAHAILCVASARIVVPICRVV